MIFIEKNIRKYLWISLVGTYEVLRRVLNDFQIKNLPNFNNTKQRIFLVVRFLKFV